MTTHQIATIDEIISLLEAQIPGNPQSPKNQKLQGNLEQKIGKYFRSLEDAFPYRLLGKLYDKYVEKEQ